MDDFIPNFLWPQYPNPAPNFVARLGILTHWVVTGLAIYWGGIAAYQWLLKGQHGERDTLLGWAIGYFAARAVRWLFSGD